MLITASTKAIVSTAQPIFLLAFAVVSFLSAKATHRVLQNHRYVAGLLSPTGEEATDRYKVVRLLATSTKVSIFAGFVQISGAVFLGVSLLARWRLGTSWSDGVFLVSWACTPASLADYRQDLHCCAEFVLRTRWTRRH